MLSQMIVSLFFIIATVSFATANTLKDFRFDGEIKLDAIFITKPLSDAGKLEMKVPAFKFNVEKDLNANTYVRTSLQIGPDRVVAIGQNVNNVVQYHTRAEEAFLAVKGLLIKEDLLRYGLITHPWIDQIGVVWAYAPLTDGGAAMLDRLNYTFRADLGLAYFYPVSDSVETHFWVLNGEGLLRDETYASKDVGAMMNYYLTKTDEVSTYLSLAYVAGRYDGYASAISQKERAHVLIAYQRQSGLSLALEGFQGKDVADAITQMQGWGIDFANGADLSPKSGQAVISTGSALYSKYAFETSTKKKFDLIFKAEYLQPAQNMPLWTWLYMPGIAYLASDKMTLLLANNHFVYNEGTFGASRLETDKWYFTLRAVF